MVKIGEISLDMRHKKTPFNLGKFYEMLHEWMLEMGYTGLNDDSDFVENLYWEDRGAAVREYWWLWRFKKKVDNKYYIYRINIDSHVMAIKDVKVVIGNKTVKLQDGEIDLTIKGWLEFDPNNELQSTNFMKMIFNHFLKKNLLSNVKFHADDLKDEMNKLQILIKKYFELYNYSSRSPNFHPIKGIGY